MEDEQLDEPDEEQPLEADRAPRQPAEPQRRKPVEHHARHEAEEPVPAAGVHVSHTQQ